MLYVYSMYQTPPHGSRLRRWFLGHPVAPIGHDDRLEGRQLEIEVWLLESSPSTERQS
jgi:hypothetical protein